MSLRRRLFVAVGAIVVLSVGVTFAVGIVLTRRQVEHANLDDLSHQADLLAQRERSALLPLAHLGSLRPYLARQSERVEVVDLAKPSRWLPDTARAQLRIGHDVKGRDDGSLYAGRLVSGKGFVLLRHASVPDWWPYVQGLLIAGLVGTALAALGAFLGSRAIARPVARVVDASRRLARGSSPDLVPVEGPGELRTLATSFNEMAEQLGRAREAERAFLLSVTHELKTPLTAIRGYAEALAEGAVNVDEAAATIRVEAARLERLVRDLLDLARLNKSEFAVHREAIDLGHVARSAVARHEADARAGDVSLEAVADGAAPAQGDGDRVLQVVSNLVENAIRSTPPGGSVVVRARPGLIAVEDTGLGLPEDDLPRAFERFFLYNRVRDGRRIGTGLGLAIVKELTEAMGGSVEVRSKPGAGTTFLVRLPPAAAAALAEMDMSHP